MKAAFLLGLVLAGLFARPAAAWWNDDWSYRKKIEVTPGAAGAGVDKPVGQFPVLIRLHDGNFRFTDAKDDGSDLRFVSGDDKTVLKYHIEKFDPLFGVGIVWVSVPDLSPSAPTDIWMYYGNTKATAAVDSKGTYDPAQTLVYHFEEKGAPAHDSTGYGNNAQTVAGRLDDAAIVASGIHLDGSAAIMLPANPSLAIPEGGSFTLSTWVNMDSVQPAAVLYAVRDGGKSLVVGLDQGVPFVQVTGADGKVSRTQPMPALAPATWHLIAVTAGDAIDLFVDGAPAAHLDAKLPALAAGGAIGGDPAAGPSGPPAAAPAPGAPPVAALSRFTGGLDEVELSNVARSPAYVRALAQSQGTDPKLVSFGTDEQASSWSTGYFATIIKSVTVDGWVVIGILSILMLLSWFVMVSKTLYVARLAKANESFMAGFRRISGNLGLLESGDPNALFSVGAAANGKILLSDSSLFRLYGMGTEELKLRFGSAGLDTDARRILSAQAIEAIRATLDAGMVRETQRLNKLMVFLTIAISGGPFLGLLGTVVGVMITFAAIAASGDVNVNAIAPGIAAALVATVAGLFVAIPALFGYNYLIGRIKDQTADMQVFIDEFVTKLAEFYQGRI